MPLQELAEFLESANQLMVREDRCEVPDGKLGFHQENPTVRTWLVATTNQQIVQPHRRKSLNTHTPLFHRPVLGAFNARTFHRRKLDNKDS